MKYRSEIDGLRALAVLPVILFHAGFEMFRGGFVGVDIFFVISGYLITSIIIADLEKNKFSIVDFYERRARRILPALFFVMLLNIPIAFFTMLPDPLENFGQSLIATSLFSNNILLYLTSGYWDLASEYKPLLHTWSLAVEEQYYILFPILMAFIWRFGTNFIISLFVILFFISLGFAQWESVNNPAASFYLLHTRAFEILIGVFLAFYLKHRGHFKSHFINESLSLVGFILIIFSIFNFNESTPFPSIYTLIPAIGTALLILSAIKDTVMNKLLSKSNLVFLGLISYSAYLFHQSIFSFMRIISINQPSIILMILGIVLTFIFAYLSYRFIESPFRNRKKIGVKKLSLLLIVPFILIISIGTLITSNNGYNERIYGVEFNKLEKSKNISTRAYNYIKDEYSNKNKLNILIIGNSFGRDIVNIILETYDRNDYEIIYSNKLNDCSVNNQFYSSNIIKYSNLIIFGSEYSDSKCISELVDKAEKNKRIFFVGAKQFGYNLNWILRIDKDKRALLRNKMLEQTIIQENYFKSIVPSDNFISYIDELALDKRILITDNDGNLISDDRQHLTLSGAQFVGNEVFRKHNISELFLSE